MNSQAGIQRYSVLVALILSVGIVVLLLIAAYMSRSSLSAFQISKTQNAFWDILLKSVAVALSISGAYITAAKFLDEKAKSSETQGMLAIKPFSEKQQEIYFSLVDATSTIANRAVGHPEREPADARFWNLYWGAVLLVEDHDVERAVDRF